MWFAKLGNKGIIGLTVFITLLLGAMLIYVFVAGQPKTPATPEQVWDVLVSQGYEPIDVTEEICKANQNFEGVLNQCIVTEKDDVHFEFFDFSDKSSAAELNSIFNSAIIREYRTNPRVEGSWRASNYAKYTLKSSGVYSATMYVGATVAYGYADAENEEKIDEILSAIGY